MMVGERLVVKIGTSTLCGPDGHPDLHLMNRIAAELTALMQDGVHVVLVSSGAIGAGRRILGLQERPQDVRMRQACAAVGQTKLMSLWRSAFDQCGRHVAQVLVTAHTFERRRSHQNLKNTMETLLALGVVPVVNENDTVSIDEIDESFGDNDRLGALVAAKLEASCYVVLSDVDGLHSKPPGTAGAARVPVIEAIDDAVAAMAGARAGSDLATGGMRTKLDAARVATDAGVEVGIVHGRSPDAVSRFLRGEDVGTRFVAARRREGRKHWLVHTRPRGRIHVDAGARDALRDGRHLLPAGVVRVEGVFDVESVVELVHGGSVLAKGLCGYSSDELTRVAGMRSKDVHATLGTTGPANVTRKGALALL